MQKETDQAGDGGAVTKISRRIPRDVSETTGMIFIFIYLNYLINTIAILLKKYCA